MNAIGYVRISRDEDKENCTSLVNQKMLILQYCVDNNINLLDIYEDDNVSGYVFTRPGFNNIVNQLKSANIDAVIAKDLSRIGRHNALTLLFIEQVKTFGKRLILVDEGSGGYDTSKDDDDIIGIKTWYNERYIKDISRKIRSSLSAKQKEGSLIIRPYFGYKIAHDTKKLVEDEETSFIVKEIFKLYLEGAGYRKIAETLNDKGYVTPSMFIAEKLQDKGKAYKNIVAHLWSSVHIRRILKNDVYTGVLRLGKTKKPGIKTKAVKVSPGEQFVFVGRHDPLIAKEDFELVQELMKKRDSINYRGRGAASTKNMNVFSGMIFCADCGAFMVSQNIKNNPKCYVCSTYHRRGKKYCTRHRIKEEELTKAMKQHLEFVKSKFLDFISTLDKEIKSETTKKGNHENVAATLNKRLKSLNSEYKELVSQKIKDMLASPEHKDIIEENYKEMINEKLQRIQTLTKQIESTQNSRERDLSFEEQTQNAITIFDGIINSETPNRKHLELIVQKIFISETGIEVQLKEDIDKLCQHEALYKSSLSIV